MKLKFSDLQIISYWYTNTSIKNNIINDIIFLKLKELDFDICYVFPRYRNYCYIDSLKDYAAKYTSSMEFVEFQKQLTEKLPQVITNESVSNRRILLHNRKRHITV